MKHLIENTLVRRAVLCVITVALVWTALAVGQGRAGLDLQVGAEAPVTFVAPRPIDVPDDAATEAAREEARDLVQDVYENDTAVAMEVESDIEGVFLRVVEMVIDEVPAPPPPNLPEEPADTTTTTSSTAPDDESPPTDPQPEPTLGRVTGLVFIDTDESETFEQGIDIAVVGMEVMVIGSDDRRTVVTTDTAGLWVAEDVVVDGNVLVYVDPADQALPPDMRLDSNSLQTFEGAVEIEADPTVFVPAWTDRAATVEAISGVYPQLANTTIQTLVDIARQDVLREATGRQRQIINVETAAVSEARTRLGGNGIRSEELDAVRTQVRNSPPPLVTIDNQRHPAAERAAADIVASFLQPSSFVNADITEAFRDTAAGRVEPVEVHFDANEVIIEAGATFNAVQVSAVEMLNLNRPTSVGYGAILGLATVLVAILFSYLARFRPKFWASERRVALFGVILVITALTIRGVYSLASTTGEFSTALGYALPVAGVGFLVSVVFDARIAVLMSVATATMTGIIFGDAGFVLYAAIATLAPVPLVSAISSSRDQRRAILVTGIAAGVIAASVAWFFHSGELGLTGVLQVTAIALGAGWVSSIVAIFLVTIFESLFDITTNLRLLELVDRNHEALQLLQEKAWGTFNHSLMVGTLADRAARSIGANPLLARAAAYYHDLGKTEAPVYFIENQFGVPNPHDRMEPKESAAVIRAHVADGLRLAARYRVPSEVTEGIMCHHGDGIMRYFYETAKERYGAENVDVEDYRHHGHKPQSREMAILMMADSLEGATRAMFADTEPTPERIASVVERVVAEKVNDGQLSDSALTLGELRQVKEAFVEALVGHYHQRIPYPNFPDAPDQLGSSTSITDGRTLPAPEAVGTRPDGAEASGEAEP